MSRKKKMSIEEFVEFGYLQEANRRYFNPLGLQLEIDKGETRFDIMTKKYVAVTGSASPTLGFVWDRRSSDSGLLLPEVDTEKADRVTGEMKKRRPARQALRECNNTSGIQVPRG